VSGVGEWGRRRQRSRPQRRLRGGGGDVGRRQVRNGQVHRARRHRPPTSARRQRYCRRGSVVLPIIVLLLLVALAVLFSGRPGLRDDVVLGGRGRSGRRGGSGCGSAACGARHIDNAARRGSEASQRSCTSLAVEHSRRTTQCSLGLRRPDGRRHGAIRRDWRRHGRSPFPTRHAHRRPRVRRRRSKRLLERHRPHLTPRRRRRNTPTPILSPTFVLLLLLLLLTPLLPTPPTPWLLVAAPARLAGDARVGRDAVHARRVAVGGRRVRRALRSRRLRPSALLRRRQRERWWWGDR
jgi:hypothetical protein